MATAIPATFPKPGDTLVDGYRIECQLGSGRDSPVFGAVVNATGQRCALRYWVGRDGASAAAAARHFLRSAQRAQLFRHPNVVEVYGVGESQGACYSVMEWLEGITLRRFLEQSGALSARDAVAMLAPCVSALSQAHAAGIVHGDVRPSNIFLSRATESERGRPRVFNFGYGGSYDQPVVWQRRLAGGSRQYIPPEELHGEALDARSDVYALGVMLYAMVSGRLPFTADTPNRLALDIIAGNYVALGEHAPHVPVPLARVVERAMALEPEQRYASAADMLHDLAGLDRDAAALLPRTPERQFVWVKPVAMLDTPELSQLERPEFAAMRPKPLSETRRLLCGVGLVLLGASAALSLRLLAEEMRPRPNPAARAEARLARETARRSALDPATLGSEPVRALAPKWEHPALAPAAPGDYGQGSAPADAVLVARPARATPARALPAPEIRARPLPELAPGQPRAPATEATPGQAGSHRRPDPLGEMHLQ